MRNLEIEKSNLCDVNKGDILLKLCLSEFTPEGYKKFRSFTKKHEKKSFWLPAEDVTIYHDTIFIQGLGGLQLGRGDRIIGELEIKGIHFKLIHGEWTIFLVLDSKYDTIIKEKVYD
jgi:hypothetical protein